MSEFSVAVGLAVFVLSLCSVLCQTPPWWQESAIYQIYPRSFQDTNGDGIGDLQGIIFRLDYIKSLGVKTIWLSPIYPSPGADQGYDISNYIDIDPMFGTLQDFDQLLKGVHDKGMYLVLDYVPNHSSDEHFWFQQSRQKISPYTDYYVWHEGIPDPSNDTNRIPPNNWLSAFQGPAWEWDSVRKEFYLHVFHKKQPDLNYRNLKVVDEMKDVLRFWLDRGVDGFRMDIVACLFEDIGLRNELKRYPPPNLPADDRGTLLTQHTEDQDETYFMVQQFRSVLNEYTNKFMMTEAYTSIYNTIRYYGTAELPGAHFPFNFGLIQYFNKDTPPQDVKNYVRDWLSALPAGAYSNWVVGNHDQRRAGNRYGLERKDFINALAVLLPGTAVTYMGEEIGMEDNTDITYAQGQDPQGCNAGPDRYSAVTRDFERSPFQWNNTTNAGFTSGSPWLPVHKNYLQLNVQEQENATESHLKIYRQLVALKNEGNYFPQVDIQAVADKVLVFIRENFVINFIVVGNFVDTPVEINLTTLFPKRSFGTFKLAIKGVGSSLELGSQLNATSFVIPPNDLAVFSGR